MENRNIKYILKKNGNRLADLKPVKADNLKTSNKPDKSDKLRIYVPVEVNKSRFEKLLRKMSNDEREEKHISRLQNEKSDSANKTKVKSMQNESQYLRRKEFKGEEKYRQSLPISSKCTCPFCKADRKTKNPSRKKSCDKIASVDETNISPEIINNLLNPLKDFLQNRIGQSKRKQDINDREHDKNNEKTDDLMKYFKSKIYGNHNNNEHSSKKTKVSNQYYAMPGDQSFSPASDYYPEEFHQQNKFSKQNQRNTQVSPQFYLSNTIGDNKNIGSQPLNSTKKKKHSNEERQNYKLKPKINKTFNKGEIDGQNKENFQRDATIKTLDYRNYKLISENNIENRMKDYKTQFLEQNEIEQSKQEQYKRLKQEVQHQIKKEQQEKTRKLEQYKRMKQEVQQHQIKTEHQEQTRKHYQKRQERNSHKENRSSVGFNISSFQVQRKVGNTLSYIINNLREQAHYPVKCDKPVPARKFANDIQNIKQFIVPLKILPSRNLR